MILLTISQKTKIVCTLLAPLVLGVFSQKQPSNFKRGSEHEEMPKNMEPKDPDLSNVKDPKEPVQPALQEPPEPTQDQEKAIKSNKKNPDESSRDDSAVNIRKPTGKNNRNARRKIRKKGARITVAGDEKLGIPYPGIPNAKRPAAKREQEDEDSEEEDDEEDSNPENLDEVDPIMREPKVPNRSIKEPKVKMSINEPKVPKMSIKEPKVPSMPINEPKPPPKMKEPKLLDIPKIKEPSMNMKDPDEPRIADDRESSILKSTDIGGIKEPRPETMTSSKPSRSGNSPRNADIEVPKILRNTDGNENTPGSTIRRDPSFLGNSGRDNQNADRTNPTIGDANLPHKGSRGNTNLPEKVALNSQNTPVSPLINTQNNPRNVERSRANALGVPNPAAPANVNGPNAASPGNLNRVNVPRPVMTRPLANIKGPPSLIATGLNAGALANIKGPPSLMTGPNAGAPANIKRPPALMTVPNAGVLENIKRTTPREPSVIRSPSNAGSPNALRSLVLTGPNAPKTPNVVIPVSGPRSTVVPGTPRIQAQNSNVPETVVIHDMISPSQPSVSQNVPEAIFMNDWNAPSVPPVSRTPIVQKPQLASGPNIQFLAVPFPNTALSEACSSSLSGALNDFAFALLKETKEDRNDMFISPLSIAVALTMTYHGSGGNTAKQMEQVLGFEKHKMVGSSVTNGFVDILATLTDVTTDYKLLMTDDMFLQKNYAVSPRYIADLMAFFMASVQNVDFVNEGLSALNQINNWVSEKTQNTIPRLFKDPLGTPEMMLISVVYFKGLWKTQFAKEKTRIQEFNKPDGNTKKVPMMTIENEIFRYLEDELTQYKFIDLPYRGEDLSMLIALPRKLDTLPDFEMTTAMLCRVNSSMKNMKLQEVVLPKFKIEHHLQLKDFLQNLGISDLFDVNSANLTGISSQSGLYISTVFHKAVIEVNEEGAKGLGPLKLDSPFTRPSFVMPKLPSFVANHPFLFYILDMRSGLVLFSGKVIDPTY